MASSGYLLRLHIYSLLLQLVFQNVYQIYTSPGFHIGGFNYIHLINSKWCVVLSWFRPNFPQSCSDQSSAGWPASRSRDCRYFAFLAPSSTLCCPWVESYQPLAIGRYRCNRSSRTFSPHIKQPRPTGLSYSAGLCRPNSCSSASSSLLNNSYHFDSFTLSLPLELTFA